MAKIFITNREGEQSEIEGEIGISVMENLRDNDYELEAICGGQCSCATCHIYIDESWMDKVVAAAGVPECSCQHAAYYAQAVGNSGAKRRLAWKSLTITLRGVRVGGFVRCTAILCLICLIHPCRSLWM